MARDPYALTLWTYWQLEQFDNRRRFLERRDRFDLAGLFTIADKDGAKFADLMNAHEATAAPELTAQKRDEALAHVAAHGRMKRTKVEGHMMARNPEEA